MQSTEAQLSTRLEHITAELEKRDLSDVPTAKLMELELKTRAELAGEFAEGHIRSEQQLRDDKASRTAPPIVPELWPKGDVTLLLEPEENGNGRKRSRHAD
jgi:hypothetical protein